MSTGIDLGLDRVRRLLEVLGNPQSAYRAIHVAGTNGKGSVCAVISAALAAHPAIPTGRFTSPHLITPRDCIWINGATIEAGLYSSIRDQVVHADANNAIGASEFEKLTATALLAFKTVGVRVAVVEVGVGGRLDATNVFDDPSVCVFTSISMDHMDLLGDTIEKIAREKAGILKRDSLAVIGPQQSEGALQVLKDSAHNLSCRFRLASPLLPPSEGKRISTTLLGADVSFVMPLEGSHQFSNVATALAAIEAFAERHPDIELLPDTVIGGVERAEWHGRLQWTVLGGRKVLVDGAHNEDSAKYLRLYVDEITKKQPRVCWIFGLKSDKNAQSIVSTLFRDGDRVLLVPFSKPEGMPWVSSASFDELEKAIKVAKRDCLVSFCSSIPEALELAQSPISAAWTTVLCGSLYLVSDAMRLRASSQDAYL